MELIATHNGYNYWIGVDSEGKYYNITRYDQPAPCGGYYSHEFICKVKNVKNLFKNETSCCGNV